MPRYAIWLKWSSQQTPWNSPPSAPGNPTACCLNPVKRAAAHWPPLSGVFDRAAAGVQINPVCHSTTPPPHPLALRHCGKCKTARNCPLHSFNCELRTRTGQNSRRQASMQAIRHQGNGGAPLLCSCICILVCVGADNAR